MLAQLFKRTTPGLAKTRTISQLVYRFSDEKDISNEHSNEITKENAKLIIDKWVKNNKVVLFMKGTPHQPMCGYSNFVV